MFLLLWYVLRRLPYWLCPPIKSVFEKGPRHAPCADSRVYKRVCVARLSARVHICPGGVCRACQPWRIGPALPFPTGQSSSGRGTEVNQPPRCAAHMSWVKVWKVRNSWRLWSSWPLLWRNRCFYWSSPVTGLFTGCGKKCLFVISHILVWMYPRVCGNTWPKALKNWNACDCWLGNEGMRQTETPA